MLGFIKNVPYVWVFFLVTLFFILLVRLETFKNFFYTLYKFFLNFYSRSLKTRNFLFFLIKRNQSFKGLFNKKKKKIFFTYEIFENYNLYDLYFIEWNLRKRFLVNFRTFFKFGNKKIFFFNLFFKSKKKYSDWFWKI